MVCDDNKNNEDNKNINNKKNNDDKKNNNINMYPLISLAGGLRLNTTEEKTIDDVSTIENEEKNNDDLKNREMYYTGELIICPSCFYLKRTKDIVPDDVPVRQTADTIKNEEGNKK